MGMVRNLFAAFFVALCPMVLAPASAQAQSPPITAEQIQSELRAIALWSANAMEIVDHAFTVLETMPETPTNLNSRATRRAWAQTSRTWSVGARATVQSAREAYAKLPPPPSVSFSPEINTALQQQHQRMPAVIDGMAAYLNRYDEMFVAVERNDPKARRALAVSSIDAIIMPIAHMRDINDLTAKTVGTDHPQSHLLSSAARSYDAMIALTNLTKAGIENDNPPLGYTAEELAEAVTAMRRHIAGGRAATAAIRQQMALARGGSPEEAALIAQARRMIETYPGSFDREERMAAAFDRISRHLATPGLRYDSEDPIVSSNYDEVVALDDARAADQQARTTAVAAE